MMVIQQFIENHSPKPVNATVYRPDDRWKKAAIKMDYMLKEMVKLGGTNDKVYPNIAPIMDLHQDINLPAITEVDKENAGVPSRLTNAS